MRGAASVCCMVEVKKRRDEWRRTDIRLACRLSSVFHPLQSWPHLLGSVRHSLRFPSLVAALATGCTFCAELQDHRGASDQRGNSKRLYGGDNLPEMSFRRLNRTQSHGESRSRKKVRYRSTSRPPPNPFTHLLTRPPAPKRTLR